MQTRTAQKGEQVRLLVAQVFGQPLIVWAMKVPIQQAVQLGFQPTGGYSQTMGRKLAPLVAIAQPEAVLQQSFDRHRKSGGRRGSHRDHFATPPDQVFQAALMKRLLKAIA